MLVLEMRYWVKKSERKKRVRRVKSCYICETTIRDYSVIHWNWSIIDFMCLVVNNISV